MAWDERDEELESQLNRGALWAVTYGDLMSYLVIFFLLLYSATATKSMSLQMSLHDVEQTFGKQSNLMQQLFSARGVQQIARLDMKENKIRIVFLSPILFDPGYAELKPASFPHLKKLAEAMLEIPNPIQIEGHTDDQPLGRKAQFKTNWELSSARAFSVLRFFEQCGIPSRRLSAIGYGEFRPEKPNDTPEGRSANRRIEINVVRRED